MEQVEFAGELLETMQPWTFGPGDRVLVRIGQSTTAEIVHEVKALLEERFPGVMFTIIQADEILVYRADST